MLTLLISSEMASQSQTLSALVCFAFVSTCTLARWATLSVNKILFEQISSLDVQWKRHRERLERPADKWMNEWMYVCKLEVKKSREQEDSSIAFTHKQA